MIRPEHVASPSPLSLDQSDYGFPLTRVRGRGSIDSVSDDEQQIASRLNALAISGTSSTAVVQEDVAFKSDDDDDEEDLEEEEEDLDEHAEETRLRYARLQARGRAAELAYNNRIQREAMTTNMTATAPSSSRRDRSRSNSKSRSRPSTPMLGALFKRDNFAMSITRSQSPPVNSVPEKSSRRPSVTNLFKFKPISRSSSSKSIHVSSTSSSVPTSPFPSPLTPLSPLPFFLSPKLRRKPMPPASTGEDIEVAALSGPSPSFGSPLTRTPRRPSPVRTMTLPDDLHYQDTTATVRRRPSHGAHVHTLYPHNHHRRRETSPLGRSDNSTVIVPALGPHLVEEEEERQSALSLIVDAQ